MLRTSRCAADHYATHALVDPVKSTRAYKALGGLQARLYGVYWEEEQVDRCARQSAGLAWSTNACTHDQGLDVPQGTARTSDLLPWLRAAF